MSRLNYDSVLLNTFKIFPEEQHLVDPNQIYYTPRLDVPILCKLPPLRLGDKRIRFAEAKQGSCLAVSICENIANMCTPSQIICSCYS